MDYSWIKAIHVAAVLAFTGGLLVQTLVLVMIHRDSTAFGRRAASDALSWDWKVTSPALLVVWAMGLWAALSAGWLTAPWLLIKLAIVVALTALHGMQSGALRRIAAGGQIAAANLEWRPLALVFAYTLTALLAVIKPFG